MSNIIWSFEGINVTFHSTPENFERDIVRMAKSSHVDPTHPIKIHQDDRTTSSDADNSNEYTASIELKSVPGSVKKTKATKATAELRDMSGDLDRSEPVDNSVQATDTSVADSSASDWLSNE